MPVATMQNQPAGGMVAFGIIVEKDRQIDDHRHQEKPPDEDDLPVAFLEQVIPSRMEKGGGQNDAQGDSAHRPATLSYSLSESLKDIFKYLRRPPDKPGAEFSKNPF